MENRAHYDYTPGQPSATEHVDTIRDCARNLSDAIKAANEAGISVTVQATPNEPSLFDIIFRYF